MNFFQAGSMNTRGQMTANVLDKVFRIIYPVLFIMFNIVFWIVLQTHVAQLN